MKHLSILLACMPIFTWANQQSIPIQNEFNRFQQQAKNQNEQLQQVQQQRWLSQHQYQTEQQEHAQADLSQVCLPYSEVKFVGFHLIDPLPFAPKKNECLNEERLNRLSQDLTSAYLALGYVYNPFQFEDDGSGKLTMRVTEGKVSLLSSNSERLNFTMLFPNILGKPLNIKDLDQALDQANKMPGSKVSVDVLPAKNGEIELSFVNEEKSRVTGYAGMDNFASKRSGRWQAKGGLNIDNPLGLSDSLYLNVSHSLKSYHHNFNRSFSFFHTIPYGYWSLSTFGSFSTFKSTLPLQYNTVEQKGYTWQAALRSDYTFQRDSNSISNLYAQLERIKSKSYFHDSLILLQSPTLTTAQIGINHLQLFSYGSLMTDFSYERGLKWWNTIANHGRDQPEGQFNRWRAELQFNAFYPIKSQIFRQSSRLVGQYSHNYLPSIKQEELLGRYAVRGLNDFSLSAEKSAVLQNNLGWLHQYKQWQIEPYLGLDIGIQKATAPDANSQKAFGYALGMKASHPRWYIQLEWATGRLFQRNQIIQERSINVNWHVMF
ncbi:ShlB/FhaC/HecB family hemolysin secretion/activation protein [Rodentibacter pneumotropicus]|uniref:ShlB/FhaC/HecB family hemolysin secretion/activation protein n=1 Tax=Rodentibacter pneumotropicus TaxID=758 RepID=A0A4S2P961_9PAST|nr:ShlB/FhaC/HecB family hemolysin secretion/activation protein [Rodentibacter pneumotropicus]TGZ99597.1 ShlB/FhaC/HecB family hemolysin secretion/activation protein [Rodentibacter pneumotropicus]TGZ99855.1 ShlB/FhaC/HecB family hemolysin secretion/activation protein [Rodentibacter pneumotropicus]THA09660.1 ShlB/FhaC/HecB family hemolysin secretion/activation protein [Rodentibacter pneumotropicus]THA15924.1 ShlB/FhaC/HecB family hemolysin secretion/activation protein [Rodentibacter pneumotropic